jgi:ribosomal protein S18 acetylase RimI-like enzyme
MQLTAYDEAGGSCSPSGEHRRRSSSGAFGKLEIGGGMAIDVRPAAAGDRPWIREAVSREWSTPFVVSRGIVYHPDELPGLVAVDDGETVGLLTYRIDALQLEIVTIQTFSRLRGVGRRLLEAAKGIARQAGCQRMWLVTTNDNTPAQSFYHAVGMRVVAVHRGAVQRSRMLKPEIPAVGFNGVPIEDEIEFEVAL